MTLASDSWHLRDSHLLHLRFNMPSSERGKAPAQDAGLLDAWQRFSRKTHATDYLGLAVLVTGYILLKLFGEPFHSQFRLDDPRIQHPHAEVERVGVGMFMFTSMVMGLEHRGALEIPG